MTRKLASLATLCVIQAGAILTIPAAAQQAAGSPAPAVCREDVICVDTSTVQSWPIDRWTTVRRVNRQTAQAK